MTMFLVENAVERCKPCSWVKEKDIAQSELVKLSQPQTFFLNLKQHTTPRALPLTWIQVF